MRSTIHALCCAPTVLQQIRTPAVLLDVTAVQGNIARMQAIADSNGCVLRPHAKTHKSINVANLQTRAGAVGITCAKPYEAIAFIREGVPSLTLAYPLLEKDAVAAVLQSVRDSALRTEVRFVVDSFFGFESLAEAVAEDRAAHGRGVMRALNMASGRRQTRRKRPYGAPSTPSDARGRYGGGCRGWRRYLGSVIVMPGYARVCKGMQGYARAAVLRQRDRQQRVALGEGGVVGG